MRKLGGRGDEGIEYVQRIIEKEEDVLEEEKSWKRRVRRKRTRENSKKI